MAKQTGLGDNFYVGGYDLSGDINSIGRIGGGPEAKDLTGIDKSAHERLGGKRDSSWQWAAYFNDTTGQAHSVFKTLPNTDITVCYFRGTTLGNAAAGFVAKQLDYPFNRADNGDLLANIEAQANSYGMDWGSALTAGKRTDTGAANGTGVDFGAATSFGLQAYLQVFAFSGTSATVKLQESSDDGSVDTYADVTGGSFTTVTGITAERIQTARNLAVERYLRVVTTGVFTNLVFAVLVAKNATEVTY